MIERNRFLDIVSHAVLIIGVFIVAFPVYITFVASTHTMQDVVQVPMPLLPGAHFWDNYRIAPGLGLRVTIPMISLAPIALDFAFPVHSSPTDLHQTFSFFVGVGH